MRRGKALLEQEVGTPCLLKPDLVEIDRQPRISGLAADFLEMQQERASAFSLLEADSVCISSSAPIMWRRASR
jgi:hypothetical protein